MADAIRLLAVLALHLTLTALPMAAMMKYWALMAVRADVIAKAATARVVTNPTAFSFRNGKTAAMLSAKPTVYRATDSPWARKSGIPMAPPASMPRDRLIM